jgi:aspartyl-tRNA(Asn)/glutamyl-tRNA(Gln) amidotransferase subunit B
MSMQTMTGTKYEVVIGMEVHAQLKTASKIFCGCSTKFGGGPNTQTCPVCLGLPGVLPVLNRRVVEMAIQAGLALHCSIAPYSRFARKNYFYPDLPKGYQISQYELPLCRDGWLSITTNGRSKRVGIRRAHLEEDAGKNLHEGIHGSSHVDLNRAGVPLLEIVTEPDLNSAEEAVEYLKRLREILVYLDVCDGNMEEGSLRCEPNLSLRPVGQKEFGTRVEVKNINSFKFVAEAIQYEVKRQEKVLREGGTVAQETRLWDSDREATTPMRSKEEAHDYRYFPEPDLVPLAVSEQWAAELRARLPELPEARRKRFAEEYGLSEYDAVVLTGSKKLADYFESCLKQWRQPKPVSNWIQTELLRLVKLETTEPETYPIRPEHLTDLLRQVERGGLSGSMAKSVFEEMYRTGRGPQEIIEAKGLAQISDDDTLNRAIEQVLAANPKEAEAYRNGKQQLLGFFVGQVMRATQGKANPGKVNELLKKRLAI